MQESLTRLLRAGVDHEAAQLSVQEALEEILSLTQGLRVEALGRLVCPVEALPELSQALADRPEAKVRLAVSAGSRGDRGSWEDSLERAADAMNAFVEASGEQAGIEAFLARAPGNAGLEATLRDLRGFDEAEVYVQLPPDEAVEDSLELLAESEWARAAIADAPPEAVASFMHTCVSLDLPFRLSLDAPLVLPALGAAALAVGIDLSRREILACLLDEDPSSWSYEGSGLAWRGRRASLQDIEAARDLLATVGTARPSAVLDALP